MLKCEGCGKRDETVVRDLDPYALEIHEEEVEADLCPDCFQERKDDI